MAAHEAVFLEEPPSGELDRMLDGRLAVADYLHTLDAEYPDFGRQMALRLRELHAGGTTIRAVEPFLEHLVAIHTFFAGGGAPDGLPRDTVRRRVYEAERDATGALIEFYAAAAKGSFDDTLAAVKRFARLDARRFALRDGLRAAEIAARAPRHRSVYVEAGPMHFSLLGRLRRVLGPGTRLRCRFLTAPEVRRLGGRHIYGPGDILTLRYIFHPGFRGPLENLLAARSLVYSKLIAKEEFPITDEAFPHTRNEIDTAAIVGRLSLADCRRLFPHIRRMTTADALRFVGGFTRQHHNGKSAEKPE